MDAAKTCALCPKLCRYLCPVATACGDENAVPTTMGSLIVLRRAGAVKYDPVLTHPLYRCTGCLACGVPCELDVDVPAYLADERELAWNSAAAPPQVVEVADRTAAELPPDPASGHHRDLDGPRFEGKGIVYWPGCALVGADPDAVERTRSLLSRFLGQEVMLPPVDAPACCGDPLRSAGDRSRYLGHRATLRASMGPASRIITSCSCCTMALPPGTEHIAAVLGYRWSPGKPERVAFHDPCHMARNEDVTGAPRALLAAVTGSPVAEFVDRGCETGCCGAGDSFGQFFPTDAADVAAYRMRDPVVQETGTVVTACSRCAVQLAQHAPDGIQVKDLADYLTGQEEAGAHKRPVRPE